MDHPFSLAILGRRERTGHRACRDMDWECRIRLLVWSRAPASGRGGRSELERKVALVLCAWYGRLLSEKRKQQTGAGMRVVPRAKSAG